MEKALRTAACALLIAMPTHAFAQLGVSFIEGAPKDRFVIENRGNCALENAEITIDLNDTAGRLIFDPTADGEGVEVFQPLEVERGREALKAVPGLRDGQSEVTFELVRLEPGAELVFTTDVDDRIGQREITVNRTEFSGARLIYRDARREVSADFQVSGRPSASLNLC